MALEKEDKETLDDFKKAVNMTAKQIEKWLDGEDSKKSAIKKKTAASRSDINRANTSLEFWAKNRLNIPPKILSL